MKQYRLPALTAFITFSAGVMLGFIHNATALILVSLVVALFYAYFRIFPYFILAILGFVYLRADITNIYRQASLIPFHQKVIVEGKIVDEKFVKVEEIKKLKDRRILRTKLFIRNAPDVECGKVRVVGVIKRPQGQFRLYVISNKACGVLKILYLKRLRSKGCSPRNFIRKILKRNSWDETNFAIFRALVLGERIGLGKNTLSLFKTTGTMHILALSGLHVGIITLIIFALFTLLRVGKNWALIATAIVLTAYLFIIGFKSSLFRAYLFFIAVIIANLAERKVDYLNVWGFAGLASLIYNPLWILNVGFQFSYLATLGIILSLTPQIRGIKGYIVASLVTSFAATLFVSPLQIYYFKLFTPVSVLTNIVAIPLVFVVLSESLIGILFNFLHISFLDSIFFEVGNFSIKILLEFLRLMTRPGFSYRYQSSPLNVYQVTILVALFCVLFVGIRRVISEIKEPGK